MLNYTFLPTTLKFVIKFLHSITNYVCSITPSLLHIHPYYVGNFSDGLPSPIANECIRKKTSRKELLMEVFLFLCRLQGIIIKSRQRWIKDFGLFDFKMDPNKVCMVFESTVWISVFLLRILFILHGTSWSHVHSRGTYTFYTSFYESSGNLVIAYYKGAKKRWFSNSGILRNLSLNHWKTFYRNKGNHYHGFSFPNWTARLKFRVYMKIEFWRSQHDYNMLQIYIYFHIFTME